MDEPAITDEVIFGENTACFFFCAQISGDCGAKPARLVRNLGGGTGELGAVAKDMFGDKNGENTGSDGGDKWAIYERSGGGDGAPVGEERQPPRDVDEETS